MKMGQKQQKKNDTTGPQQKEIKTLTRIRAHWH